MSGDYSRHRFNPRNNYAGVKMQQGRVQLDADWNEWTDAIDRRTRAETVDTLGVAMTTGIGGVAVVSPQTPGGFLIEAGDGSFTIGQGRMYVDGLLAENFGDEDGPQSFDPVLAELRGLNPIAYDRQPYHLDPADLPGGGPHLAYLEVWQREVTHLQDPDLVEKAVGVDTTTRTQTVWQVRLLEKVASSISCTSPDSALGAAWAAIISPSAGRLSSRAVEGSTDLDPCELPPSGGYRGLENQLYRIEIHDGGGVGTATFKWSRDNGCVAINVVEMVSSTELKLAGLGRDELLRFNTGDWIEIIDDWRELSGEAGDPARRRGEMRKITVHEAKQTISFTTPLPANLIPTGGGGNTLEKRHLRVIRWDQKGVVRDADNKVTVDLNASGSKGLIPVPAPGVWVHLENGIQVQFDRDPAAGSFRCSDYWTVAARTGDATVEVLTEAPPLGIHRHYARLALLTLPSSETDCREHWPPDCGGGGCCTVIVEPGDNIQRAINSLPKGGGCVCLRTGIHTITAAIEIMAPDILLCGEGPGAIVRSTITLPALLQIGSNEIVVTNVEVKDIRFETSAETDGSSMLYLSRCRQVHIHRCGLDVRTKTTASYLGVWMENCSDVTVDENNFRGVYSGIQADYCRDVLTIAQNYIVGPYGQYINKSETSLGNHGIRIQGGNIRVGRLEGNIIVHFWNGIFISGDSKYCCIINNFLYRNGGATESSFPTNTAELRQYLNSRVYALHVEASCARIKGNYINLPSPQWGGIRSSGHHTIIQDNSLEASEKSYQNLLAPASIYCLAEPEKGLAADHSDVCNNNLVGVQTGINLSGINGATVESNHIDGNGNGWFGVRVDDCYDTTVRNNDLRDLYFAINLTTGLANRILGNRIDQAGAGLVSFQENYLEAANNTISSCPLFGMILLIDNNAFLTENRVINCSYINLIGVSLGIAVFAENIFQPSEALTRIEGCEVLNTGVSPDGKIGTKTAAISIGGLLPACRVSHNRTGYTATDQLDVSMEHRSLLLIGPLAYDKPVTNEAGPQNLFGSAIVTNNKFTGPGFSSLVQFMHFPVNENIDFLFRDVTFANNVCEHLKKNPDDNKLNATVLLEGGSLVVMGNHINAGPGVNSLSLGDNRATLMGNVTTGAYIKHGGAIPTPIDHYNIRL